MIAWNAYSAGIGKDEKQVLIKLQCNMVYSCRASRTLKKFKSIKTRSIYHQLATYNVILILIVQTAEKLEVDNHSLT
jgi:hypothetical protein